MIMKLKTHPTEAREEACVTDNLGWIRVGRGMYEAPYSHSIFARYDMWEEDEQDDESHDSHDEARPHDPAK